MNNTTGLIEITHREPGRCQISHPVAKESIVTDLPPEYGGRGASFSSTDLVAAGLGSCLFSSMEPILARSDLDPGRLKITVKKELLHNPKRVGALQVDARYLGVLPESVRVKLLRAAGTCPVKRSLHPDIKIEMELSSE